MDTFNLMLIVCVKKSEILAKILRWKVNCLCEITELLGIYRFEIIICMRKTCIQLKYFFMKNFG